MLHKSGPVRKFAALTLLLVLLSSIAVPVSAKGLTDVTATEAQRGFDVGRPTSISEHNVGGVTRPEQRSYSSSHKQTHRRSAAQNKPVVPKTTVSAAPETTKPVKPKKDKTTEPEKETRRAFISRIDRANEGESQDPLQSEKGRKVADFLMMGIAGFSIVAILLWIFTAGRRNN